MPDNPTTEAVDLKPCPFCGVAADGPNIDRGYDDGLRRMWIECPHCAANMDRLFGSGISDADGVAVMAQLWNRRPSHEPDGRLIEATAELIYLRQYGKDGARWDLNESKDVWRDKARAALTKVTERSARRDVETGKEMAGSENGQPETKAEK